MNEQRLEMKYHPAKKEVRFRGIGFEISWIYNLNATAGGERR